MKIAILFTFLGIFALSFSQEEDKVDQITVTIAPYKHASNGAFHTFLALTCSDRGVEHIEGFDFNWGYTYELELKRTKRSQPMEDAGDTDYQLIEIISKRVVDDSTIFHVNLTGWVQLSHNTKDDSGAFTFNPDGTCTFLGELNFHCSNEIKKKLKALNKAEDYKKGTFMFLNREIHLISV